MRIVAILVMLWPGAVLAWDRLDGGAIEQALSDRTLVYDAHTLQHFHASGATDYITERFSSGRWEVRGDQYCSSWPPSDVWACYDVELEGEMVRFISSDGSASVGTYRE